MSTGQLLGGVIGAVAGSFAGNTVIGAQIGMTIGGLIDPPKGPDLNGPKVGDLTQQTSTYGAVLPRIYSTTAICGNVIWLNNDQLKVVEGSEGGGKGTPATPTITYYATFAVAFCEGEVSGFGRIWMGSDLVYDPYATTLKEITKSKKWLKKHCTLYYGTEDQEPDADIQADKGVENTPAYTGICYGVFKNIDLTPYGNSLAGCPVKAEVFKNGAAYTLEPIQTVTGTYKQTLDTAFFPQPYYMDTDKVIWYVPNWYGDYPATSTFYKYICDTEKCWLDKTIPTTSTFSTESPPAGVTDNKKHYYQSPEYAFGADFGDVCGNGSGFFRQRDNLNVGVDWDSGQILICEDKASYNPQSYASITPTTLADASASCADTDGSIVYVVYADGIRTYNLNLELIDYFDHDLSAITDITAATCCLDGDYLYIFNHTRPDVSTEVYKWKISTNTLTSLGNLAPIATGSNSGGIIVKDGIIVRAFSLDDESNNKTFTIQWYDEGGVRPTLQTLGEIVEAECLKSELITSSDIDVTDLTEEVRGYCISSLGAIRSNLEPLRGVWPFDVIQDGYGLKCIRRGKTSIDTITADELDARSFGDASKAQLVIDKEMDTQLPQRVSISYYDIDRDYDVGEQFSERLNTPSIQRTGLQTAVVLNADEAKQVSEVLLFMYWLDRFDVQLNLPQTYLHLQPADVVTVNGEFGTYELRLTEINYLENGMLECKAKYNNAAIYTSTAVGETGNTNGGGSVVDISPDSYYELLDLPCWKEEHNTYGFSSGMSGDNDAWPGGVIVKSTDGGATFSTFSSFGSEVSTAIAVNTITTPANFNLIDTESLLQVTVRAGEFESITNEQMLNGTNLCAYGQHGRWEIIAFKTSTLQGDGSYILQNMLRGLCGTEYQANDHEVGDMVVLLSDEDVLFNKVPSTELGNAYVYRGITKGQALDSDDDQSFTYDGENFRPLAPINATGYISQSNEDWVINITRRDRLGFGWRNYSGTPMSETASSFKMYIYTSNARTTLKRTITSSTEDFTYTAAQQIADFGDIQRTIYTRFVQVSSVLGDGRTGDFNLTYTPNDTYWANVAFLLHFGGTNGSTTFIDNKGHTFTASASAQISTAQSVFGGSSLKSTSSGDLIYSADSADYEIGSGAFFFECRLMMTTLPALGAGYIICRKGTGAGSNISWAFTVINNSGNYYLRTQLSSDGTTFATDSLMPISVVANTWYAVAWARDASNNLWGFQNGTRITPTVGGTTSTTNCFNGSGDVQVGTSNVGYIDEARLTRGICRATANYTVSTYQFPDM